MKPMKREIQKALREQPKKTKDRDRVARKVTPAAGKGSGQKASKPATGKGSKE
jgi:hypothetical protein